jgi:chromosome segregation ATPase
MKNRHDYQRAIQSFATNTTADALKRKSDRLNLEYGAIDKNLKYNSETLNIKNQNLNYATARLDNLNSNIMSLENELTSGKLTPEQITTKQKQLENLQGEKAVLQPRVNQLTTDVELLNKSLQKYYESPVKAYDEINKKADQNYALARFFKLIV